MIVGRFVRSLYGSASKVALLRGPLDALRSQPTVRRAARRRSGVLLGPGSTWTNVDGALRLLAEDPSLTIAFGPWEGDVALELLYWLPFVRWAREAYALDPARLIAVSHGDVAHWYADACATYVDGERATHAETTISPRVVLELVAAYRAGTAPVRPLVKRARYAFVPPPTAAAEAPGGYVALALSTSLAAHVERLRHAGPVVELDVGVAESRQLLREHHAVLAHASALVSSDWGLALLGVVSAVPTIVVHETASTFLEPDIDLALRVGTVLGTPLTVLESTRLDDLAAALSAGRPYEILTSRG